MKKLIILFFLTLFLSMNLSAQKSKEEKNKAKKEEPQKNDLYISLLPVIGSNPAFGFMYGAGTAISSYLGEPNDTKISSALVGFTLTTKNQFIFTAKSTVYLNKNQWILNGDWRYLNSSQPTYGLGTGPISSTLASNGFEYDDDLYSAGIDRKQQMDFKLIRFYEVATKNVGNNIYAGIGYHLDYFYAIKDQLLDLDTTIPVITSYYAYNIENEFKQDKSITSGISFNGIYDTRDNQNAPYVGQYANLSFVTNFEFLGSDKNSTTLWTEYRHYLNLTPDNKNILAFWGIGDFTISGNLPYMNLPAIGWDQYAKTGRGYTQGRFRGKNLAYAEIEFRKHLFATKNNPTFFGMTVFANMTTTDNKAANIKLFDEIAPGVGAGLRINLNQKARTNLVLDYAIGRYNSSAFFLRLNEAF